MNYFTKITIAFFVTVCMLSSVLASEARAQEIDYRSQSLYIYKFTKLITWPSAYGKDDFVIGVLGNSDIVKELNTVATLKRAGNGQRIVVKQFDKVEDIGRCHILYITSAKSRELQSTLDKLQNSPTLIIAEREGMAKKGAGINFVAPDADTLRFDFNKAVLDRQQLKMSTELTALGSEVN